jgi:uncharacterized Zn finger protein (UPF0148 family)
VSAQPEPFELSEPGTVRSVELVSGPEMTSLAIPDDVLLEEFLPKTKWTRNRSPEALERKRVADLEKRYEKFKQNVDRGSFPNGRPLPEMERRCSHVTAMDDGTGRVIGCLTYRKTGEVHCYAHSPTSLWKTDPEKAKEHGAKGRLTLRRRAALRAFYTQGGKTSVRGHLAALAHIEKHSIAEKVIEAVTLQPETHSEAMAQAGLALIDTVDPLTEARIELTLPDSLEDVEALDFETISRLAGEDSTQLGIPSSPELEPGARA